MKPIYDIATFTDSNTGVSPSMYQATIDWGDGNESQGIITAGTSGFIVTSSNVFAAAGTLTITVTITDPSGATIAATGTATVVGITTTTQSITQDPGVPFSGIVGTFTNSMDSTGSDSYTGYVNWGSGVWAAAAIQPDPSGSNVFDIVSTNPTNAQGTYNPSVMIQDNTNDMNDQDIIPPDPDAVSPPTTPTYTVSTDDTAVTLTWTNTATNATAVEIEEYNETPNYDGIPIDGNFHTVFRGSTSTGSQSQAIMGLTPGGEYQFEVRSVGVGEDSYSSPIDVTMVGALPPAPTLSVAMSTTSSGFTFTETDSDTTDTLSYGIEFKETDSTTSGNTVWQDWFGPEGDSGSEVGPLIGQAYEFRAIAENGSAESAPSAVVSITDTLGSTPAAPTGFTAQWDPTYGSSGQIDISYDDLPSADDGDPAISYSFVQNGITYPLDATNEDAVVDGSSSDEGGTVSFAFTISNEIVGGEGGTDVYFDLPFRIEANAQQYDLVSGSGYLPAISPDVLVNMPPMPGSTPPGSARAAPSNLTAVYDSSGDGAVDLVWDDNSNNETDFDVYESTNGGTTWSTDPVATTGADNAVVPVALAGAGGGGQAGAFDVGNNTSSINASVNVSYEIVATDGLLDSGDSNQASPPPVYDIYLLRGNDKTGKDIGTALNNMFHESIGFGINGKVQVAYSFGLDTANPTSITRTTASTQWNGLKVTVPAGNYQLGLVYQTDGKFQTILSTKACTSQQQAQQFLAKLTSLMNQGQRDVYTVSAFNCIVFSQLEFKEHQVA